jgi:predicted GNAT family N-acyltransferase
MLMYAVNISLFLVESQCPWFVDIYGVDMSKSCSKVLLVWQLTGKKGLGQGHLFLSNNLHTS